MVDNGIVQTTCTDALVVCDDGVFERSDFVEVNNPTDDTSNPGYRKVYQCHEIRYTLAEYLVKALALKK